MNKNLIFKFVSYPSQDYPGAVALCEEVLRKPLGLNFSPDEAEEEKNYVRVAGFLGEELCATAMLVQEGDVFKMQRVAVKQDLQNKGIGSQLLKFCEDFAAQNSAKMIYCHARDSSGRSAVNFYLKNEYFCEDEEIIEDGIAHKFMWKPLLP